MHWFGGPEKIAWLGGGSVLRDIDWLCVGAWLEVGRHLLVDLNA